MRKYEEDADAYGDLSKVTARGQEWGIQEKRGFEQDDIRRFIEELANLGWAEKNGAYVLRASQSKQQRAQIEPAIAVGLMELNGENYIAKSDLLQALQKQTKTKLIEDLAALVNWEQERTIFKRSAKGVTPKQHALIERGLESGLVKPDGDNYIAAGRLPDGIKYWTEKELVRKLAAWNWKMEGGRFRIPAAEVGSQDSLKDDLIKASRLNLIMYLEGKYTADGKLNAELQQQAKINLIDSLTALGKWKPDGIRFKLSVGELTTKRRALIERGKERSLLMRNEDDGYIYAHSDLIEALRDPEGWQQSLRDKIKERPRY